MLSCHGSLASSLFHLLGNLTRHSPGASSFFLRVSEHAESLEPGFTNEIEERLKIGLRLSRKPNDERRAQGNAGNPEANSSHQLFYIRLRSFATHPFQHVLVDV